MKKYKISFIVLTLFLITIGTIMRIAPLFDEFRLRSSINDDGYYMMTVARNIALGYGMSISDGQIMTNGIQPLYTFMISGLFWLDHGDKIMTIKFLYIIQLIISCITFFVIWKIGICLFKAREDGLQIALFAAALWYSNPLTMIHTTNGLETGFYTLFILLTIWLFFLKIKNFNLKSDILFGFILGVGFWIRNDIIFLVSSICLSIIFYKIYDSTNIYKNILHAFVIGLLAFLITLPWLIYNKINFGNIIPISAQSEYVNSYGSTSYEFVPSVLVEYFFSFYPLSHFLKYGLLINILYTIILLFIFAFTFRYYNKFSDKQKQIFFVIGIFGLGLSMFYGFFMGTYFFLSRYLFPLSTFIYLFWSVGIFFVLEHIRNNTFKSTLAIIFTILIITVSIKYYQTNYQRAYFHFIDWTEKNLQGSEWIGSFQSGTIGYYYDKTINLDGKVNPEALKAIKNGKIYEYICQKKIDFLIDDIRYASLNNIDIIRDNYELIVEDQQRNMVVFRRKYH